MCEHCGMAYSFFFNTQFHLATCPTVAIKVERAKALLNSIGEGIRSSMDWSGPSRDEYAGRQSEMTKELYGIYDLASPEELAEITKWLHDNNGRIFESTAVGYSVHY